MSRISGCSHVALILGALVAGAFACSKPSTRPPPPARNLVLFVMDTLRADRLGVYGNPKGITPRIDSFARSGIVFERAWAPSPHTVPSHASLFSSTYPATHLVWNDVPLEGGQSFYPALSPDTVTLAEQLVGAGFQTAAIADGGWVSTSRGLSQGFAHFDSVTRGTDDRVDASIRWLAKRDGRRFFLFVHSYEVHAPYMPPQGTEDLFAESYDGPVRGVLRDACRFAESKQIEAPTPAVQRQFFKPVLDQLGPSDYAYLLALYDAELRVADSAFGRLIEYLQSENLLDETLVILTADYGEEFWEHGKHAHQQLYEEVVHIPLIARDPGGPTGIRRSDLVDLIDVMPTALSSLGLPVPATAAGRDVSLRSESSPNTDRMLVAQVNAVLGNPAQFAVRSDAFKVLFSGEDRSGVEVYALDEDPSERTDIAGSERAEPIVEQARRAVDDHLERARRHQQQFSLRPDPIRSSRLNARQRNELRMLGYIED